MNDMSFKNAACLFKVMKDNNHVKDFIQGNLFMKSVRYYREQYEDGDELEGITAYYPKGHKVGFAYGKDFEHYFEIEVKSCTTIISEISGMCDHPIMCLGMFWPEDDFSPEKYGYNQQNRNYPLIDENLQKYGNHVVLVEYDKFINKIKHTCEENEIDLIHGPVSYYNEDLYKRLLNDNEHPSNTLFHKRYKYFKEREYRICIYSKKIEKEKHFILEIGDISDICDVLPFNEAHRNIRLNLS